MRCSRRDKSKCVLRCFHTDWWSEEGELPMLIYVYETLLVTGGIDHEYQQLKWVLLRTCLASQFHKEQNFGQNQSSGGDFVLHQSGNTGIPLWTWRIWMREQIKLEATESHNSSALWLGSRLRDEIKTVTVLIKKKASVTLKSLLFGLYFSDGCGGILAHFSFQCWFISLRFADSYFCLRSCYSLSIGWKSGFWFGLCNTLQLPLLVSLL